MTKQIRTAAPATAAQRSGRITLVVAAFLLPTLSLIPLGGLYLWDKGWMLWWALAALATVVLATLAMRGLLNQAAKVAVPDLTTGTATETEALSTVERLAWSDVRAIAASVDVAKINSADAVIELGQRTIDAVARRLHPDKSDAVWRFTLPQALAISERVSARLGDFVETRIPFGDRLTVAQLLNIYGWRRYIGVAEQAYDVWRLIRMANPATAVTQEARERLSRSLMTWGKEHVSRRITEAYVEEVGRAAIELYGGRLPTGGGDRRQQQERRSPGQIALHDNGSAPSVLVVGAVAAEREALAADLRALFAEPATANAFGRAIDVRVTEAIDARGVARRQLARAVAAADVVVWTVSAVTGPTLGDDAAIAELRRLFAATDSGVVPAMIVAAGGAPTDAAADLARYVGDLAGGLGPGEGTRDAPASLVLALAAPGTARRLDLARLGDAATRALAQTRSARAELGQRDAGSRGFWSSAGQAAAAVGGLAGTMLRPGPRQP